MGKSKRNFVEIKTKTPGSGTYEHKNFFGEGPKFTFRPTFNEDGTTSGKRNPKAYKKKDVPGPGTYEIKDNKNSPEYTIGLKRYPKKIKNLYKFEVPGVGIYEVRKDKDFVCPCSIFDKAKRNNLIINDDCLKFPPLTKYKIRTDSTESKSPQWSIYKHDRFSHLKPKSAFLKRLKVPGPGKYTSKTFIGEGPHFSFGKDKYNHSDPLDELELKKRKNYPSPVSYHLNINYCADGPFYSISKLQRKNTGSDKFMISLPGPTTYNPNKDYLSTLCRSPKWGTSRENRDEDEEVKGSKKLRIITPGPGHYKYKSDLYQGPKYTMAKKLKKLKTDEKPAPGDYKTVMVHYPTEPKYSMGKDKKKDEDLKQKIKDNFPGPGSYKIHDVDLTNGLTFPKAKKSFKKKFFTPGPGQYKIPTAFDYISDLTRDKGCFDPTYRYV